MSAANQVTFANPPTAGGGPGANAGGPPNQAGGQANQAAAAVTNPPAVSNAVTWENLVKIDTLPNHSIAKGLAVQHKDAAWEDVVAPFDKAYHADSSRVARELAVAPALKCFLAVNDAGSVQLVYGLCFCFVVSGQGERMLALGGERSVIAGIERPPDLLSLKGNVNGQATHFGVATVRAAEMDDIITAFDADENKVLMDPLVADANDAAINPEVSARRALVIHPKLGLLFLQPQSPIGVLRLVKQIQAAVPAAFRDKLTPLINFARVAITAAAAGGQQSSLKTDWQRIDHGTDPALVTWYYELVGTCAQRYVPAPLTSQAGAHGPGTAPTIMANLDPQFGAALQQLASSNDILAERKTTTYKQHELDELYKLCQTPILLERERNVSDLPGFWIDFHKHRGKINDARGYIECYFGAHYPQDGALECVLFGHPFVQDMMAHNLHGRDRMTEFEQRYRGFSVFSVAPLDLGGSTGEAQRQEFVRQEGASLRLDETVALEKKNDKLMDAVIKWPTNILEFRRFMEHMQHRLVTELPEPAPLYPLERKTSTLYSDPVTAPPVRQTTGTSKVPNPVLHHPPRVVCNDLFNGLRANDALQGPLPDTLSKGKSTSAARSLMQPQDIALRILPAAMTLQLLKFANQGCPVDCGAPWPLEVIKRAMLQGPHVSAMTPENAEVVWEDCTYQKDARFGRIVARSVLFRGKIPKELKISRVAVVPQQDRRGRIILNLSAPVNMTGDGKSRRGRRKRQDDEPGRGAKRPRHSQPSVNETTVEAEDQGPVKALGTALLAILMFMFEVDPDWVIDWQKIDLSDGFWRMIVELGKEYNFVYQLPRREGDDEDYFMIPSQLQMGWKNSPAYFCTATEAGRELLRRILALTLDVGIAEPHRHEKHCVPGPIPEDMAPWTTPTTMAFLSRMFVDDYINGVAGPPERIERQAQLLWASRASLHSIHGIFPPPEVLGHEGGRDSVSERKLLKGDAMFKPKETLLGAAVCGEPRQGRAVNIPTSKMTKYCALVEEALVEPRNYITMRAYTKIHGKIQYCRSLLPHYRGFMSPLNRELGHGKQCVGLGKGSDVRESFSALVPHMKLVEAMPVHITELVAPDMPHVYGGVDATAVGMGGYIAPCTIFFIPVVWRVAFPDDIRRHVESQGNVITNSDVEAIAVFVFECMIDDILEGRTEGISSHLLSDNTPTVSWLLKYASKASSRIPERILRLLALRHRWNRRGLHDIEHWPGKNNLMPDFSSRSYEQGFADTAEGDAQFLTEFQRRFPLPPQLGSWRIVRPRTEIISAAFSILRNQIDFRTHPETVIGDTGLGSTLAVERGDLFRAFAKSLRRGRHGGDGPAFLGTQIEVALRECAQFMVARRLEDPRRLHPEQRNLNSDIKDLLTKYKNEDPAPQPQIALPSFVIHYIAINLASSAVRKLHIVGNLIIMAYFFLLRVGEYTPSSEPRQTVPLCKKDIRLRRNNQVLSNDSDLMTLLTADAVTICLENQKNGGRMATVHHYSSGDGTMDPVHAVGHLISALHGMPDTTPLGTFINKNGQQCRVRSSSILAAVRLAADRCNLASYGYDIKRIGSHSLRSGGAMQLKLAGYDHDIIRKLGRWRSDTYLIYIQSQIGELTAGVSRAMARLTWFHNVG